MGHFPQEPIRTKKAHDEQDMHDKTEDSRKPQVASL
jgi:hypothetical protein